MARLKLQSVIGTATNSIMPTASSWRRKRLVFSGLSPDGELVELVEYPAHPWFVACQFHPEFQSTPLQAHPCSRDLWGRPVSIAMRLEGVQAGLPARARDSREYERQNMPKRTDIQKIMIIGSGPIVIGQGCEFDYSGVQACKALREEGYEVVLVNSNPATIMTDPEFADRTYLEPLDVDVLTEIIRRERPDALLPTLGGQTALNLAMKLALPACWSATAWKCSVRVQM
jgi:hypothetical protein